MSTSLREEIERKLKEKLKEGPGTGEIIIASKDGLTIASTLGEAESRYVDEVSAYSTQIVKQVKNTLSELGLGSPRFIKIKTEDGTELNIYVKGDKIVIYIS